METGSWPVLSLAADGLLRFPGEKMAEVFVRVLRTAGGGRARLAGEAALGHYAEGSHLPLWADKEVSLSSSLDLYVFGWCR